MLNLMRGGKARTIAVGAVVAATGGWLAGVVLRAQAPAWWSQRGVLLAGAVAEDFAILNQGQLKQFALAALGELEERLSEGAGPELHALLNLWCAPDSNGERVPIASPLADDYAPVNIGQLKAVALPFRERLAEAGIQLPDPFSAVTPDDYALANIGQAKQFFQVDLSGQKVEGLSGRQDVMGITLQWTSADPLDTYTVYGVDGYADRKSLTVLQADLKTGMARISNDIAAKFENIAVQVRRKNVWGEIQIFWEAKTSAGLLPDPIPEDPLQDTDNDGVADRKDGWPLDPDFAPPRAPRPGYAVLPLPDEVEWVALNERASVAGNSQQGAEFWKNGRRTLIRENATVVAMNDQDQVLIQYEREATPSEYNLNVARAVGLNLEGSGQNGTLWYPDWYAKPLPGEPGEWIAPHVQVSGVWSPQAGLKELSEVREVAQENLWPRWTNGSCLFTINGQWIDNAGVVYGEARVALLLNQGSLDPIGSTSASATGSEADQGGGQGQTSDPSSRWIRGIAMNKWNVRGGGFVFPLNLSGEGIGQQGSRWYQSVSSTGQELVGCWEPTLGRTRFELNGVSVEGGFFTEVHNPLAPRQYPIMHESSADWHETLWIFSGGHWLPKAVGSADVHWASLGSLASRIQRSDAQVPAERRLMVRSITDSGLALGTAFHTDEAGALVEPLEYQQALFVPVTPSAPEVYMFSGHEKDVVRLSAGAGSDLHCEWRMQNPSPEQGQFASGESEAWGSAAVGTTARFRAGVAGSPNIAGHSRAQSPGRNKIELWIEGVRVLEKPVEIVEIKPRAFWGAEAADVKKLEGMGAPNCVTLHHTASNKFGAKEVLNIQKHHTAWGLFFIGGKSWGDIGYHFLLDPSDPDPLAPVALYEGRQLEGLGLSGGPWTKASAVMMKNTAAGINVSMLGNYHTVEETFTPVRAKRAEKVLTALFLRYGIGGERLRTHRGLASLKPVLEPTVCPGWQVINYLTPELMRKAVRDNLE